MRREIVTTMYNDSHRRDLTEKSGTTVFLCMLHVLLLPVVKPMYSIAFRTAFRTGNNTGVQVFLLWGKVLC